MRYDVHGHLPTQVELLMVSYQKADVPGMQRSLDNILAIVDNKKFHSVIDKTMQEKLCKAEEMKKKAEEAVKTLLQAKNFSEIYIDLEEIKKDFIAALEMLEKDYWHDVIEMITSYVETTSSEEQNNEDKDG